MWQPKAYAGSYGTNGFHLPFSDNSTAAALGTDTSSNGNTWTVNNLSVTAGACNDSLRDSPTNGSQTDTGVGGEVVGNYATFNPLRGDGLIGGLTNGNLDVRAAATGNDFRPLSTIGVSSGKWYWEVTKTYAATGVLNTDFIVGIANATDSGGTYGPGSRRDDPIDTVYGVSIDFDTLTFAIKKDNVALYSTSIVANTYFAFVDVYFYGAAASATVNFGQRPFAYTAPSGFKALCTTNLAEPTIADGSTAMDVVTYTGNGTTKTISGLNFSPDLVWLKNRTTGYGHILFDSVRGAGSSKALRVDSTTNEGNAGQVGNYGNLTSFNSDGFTLGTTVAGNTINYLNESHVGWTWDAGSSTVTNTEGSITSQVRANASAGFSVVTYTGNGNNATVGHGLNVVPALVITKDRSATNNWLVVANITGYAGSGYLNLTDAFTSRTLTYTSTTFRTLNAPEDSNNGANYVAYCFAPVSGYSSAFSWTGNNSTDGPFIFLGFRPKLLLLKQTTTASTTNWVMLDTAREGYNVDNDPLWPNLADQEGTTDLVDILSNGFKIRSTDTSVNASSGTYIGYAWAENPFQYSRAR